jgi:hypothetical protein
MLKFRQFFSYQNIIYSVICLNLLSVSTLQAMEEEEREEIQQNKNKRPRGSDSPEGKGDNKKARREPSPNRSTQIHQVLQSITCPLDALQAIKKFFTHGILPPDLVEEILIINRNTFALLSQEHYSKTLSLRIHVKSPHHALDDDLLLMACVFPNLTSLDLGKNSNITDASLRQLLMLRSLQLGENQRITYNSIQPLTNLTSLELGENQNIPNTSLRQLTTLEFLNGYKVGVDTLILDNSFTDRILGQCKNLTCLHLGWNNKNITDASLQELTNLMSLNLGYNGKITDVSLQVLTNLASLDLGLNNNITDVCLQKLTNLTSLDLRENENITDAALGPLINLTKLNLQENTNNITQEGLQHLTNLIHLAPTSLLDIPEEPLDVDFSWPLFEVEEEDDEKTCFSS